MSLAEVYRPEYSDSERVTVNAEHTFTDWVSLTLLFANVGCHQTILQSMSARLPRFYQRERESDSQEQLFKTNYEVKTSSSPFCS